MAFPFTGGETEARERKDRPAATKPHLELLSPFQKCSTSGPGQALGSRSQFLQLERGRGCTHPRPPTYPFTSQCAEGTLRNAPRKPLLDSPFSLKNPQPVTQQDWDALGGPALNGGRQPGPTRLPQTTGGVTFMRAMSLASEMEEYLS